MKKHPCLSCGACCAHFRVSFYWAETEPDSFHVPVELTEKLNDHRAFMRGTDALLTPRCVALHGEVGRAVECQIHPRRPSPCRDFEASFENGLENSRCSEARKRKGLPALTRQDWEPL